jgi:hypothetical protein
VQARNQLCDVDHQGWYTWLRFKQKQYTDKCSSFFAFKVCYSQNTSLSRKTIKLAYIDAAHRICQRFCLPQPRTLEPTDPVQNSCVVSFGCCYVCPVLSAQVSEHGHGEHSVNRMSRTTQNSTRYHCTGFTMISRIHTPHACAYP